MSRTNRLLLAILSLAFVLRLWVALTAPWYWDEGYVAELALSLAQGGRPQVGALWHDGFFPLSTSWLAPWSAAPLASLPFWSPMTGVRVWALGWDLVAVLALYLLGRRAGGVRAGLLAAGAYAVLPFAVQHGGRAFYHHQAAALLLLGLLAGQAALENGKARDIVLAALALAWAVVTCYWLWWLPLLWILFLAVRQPRRLPLALVCLSPLPLAVLALQVLPDPASARWSVASLLATTAAGAPRGLVELLRAWAVDLKGLVFFLPGLAGLTWLAARDAKRWTWPALVLFLAALEPARQRGIIVAMPYPFIPAAPLAALGAATLADRALRASRLWAVTVCLALGFLWLRPFSAETLEAWSAEPGRVAELKAFFASRPQPGGLVCGLPAFNWALKGTNPVCEPFEIGAAEGRASGFYVPGAPTARFAHPCRLEDVRYAVLSRAHYLGTFRFEGTALTFLEMERQGWPLVFDSPAFKVHENPRFGVKADPSVRILQGAENYVTAAGQAQRAGRADAERFARERALALGWKP